MGSEDLQAWIDAVDRVEIRELPTREEMRSVARDVGLDESILDRAAERAEELLLQGNRFLENGLPGEAVGVLEQARALEPWSIPILEGLGRAQLALYRHSGASAALEAAEHVARLLIDQNAESPAGYALLKDLRRRGASRLPLWVGGGLAVVLLGLGGWWALQPVPTVVVPAAAQPAPSVRVGDLDVEILPGPLPAEAEIEVTHAEVTKTSGGEGWILNVGAVLRNGAPLVFELAIATVKVLDAQGNPLSTADLAFIESHDPARYQGDRAEAEVYLRGARSAGTPARLVVELTRLSMEPGSRVVGEAVPVSWAVQQPTSLEVAVTLREGGVCKSAIGRSHCGGIFVVENTGTVPIEILKVAALFGDSGARGETYAVAARNRALRPGERQPFRVASGVDGEPQGPWTLEVIDVRTP